MLGRGGKLRSGVGQQRGVWWIEDVASVTFGQG